MTRQTEIDKYIRVFKDPAYKMGKARREEWQQYLRSLIGYKFESLCDVGTGRGEALADALSMGFTRVRGFDVVPYLCTGQVTLVEGIHRLPDHNDAFDVVSCQDVLEHIEEADVADGLSELIRIARCKVYLSIAWFPSSWRGMNGAELHITCHETDWWEDQVWKAMPRGSTTRVLESTRNQTCRIEITKRTLPSKSATTMSSARSMKTQETAPLPDSVA